MPDEVDPYRPPDQPEPTARGWRSWSTLQVVLVSLAGLLVVSGLAVVGVMLAVAAAMNQWASNK